jgi:hypothetical protein
MLLHHHEPGVFDPDHCRTCARRAGLLDHYHRVQHQEAASGRRIGMHTGRCGRRLPWRCCWRSSPC